MKNEALFTVIIPSFNRGYILSEAIDSVLSQGIENIQIIVVDDGSTDNTREIIGAYENKIDYHYQQNQGQSVARNLGLQNARGTYICFLDSDDIFLANKLEAEKELFLRYPEADALFSIADFFLFGELQEKNHCKNIYSEVSKITPMDALDPIWQNGNIAATCAHSIKRSFIENLGLSFDANLRNWEDWDFFSRVYQYGNTYILPKTLTAVRRFEDDTRQGRHMPGTPRTMEQERSRTELYTKVLNRIKSRMRTVKAI